MDVCCQSPPPPPPLTGPHAWGVSLLPVPPSGPHAWGVSLLPVPPSGPHAWGVSLLPVPPSGPHAWAFCQSPPYIGVKPDFGLWGTHFEMCSCSPTERSLGRDGGGAKYSAAVFLHCLACRTCLYAIYLQFWPFIW